MRNAELREAQAGVKTAGRNINNADMPIFFLFGKRGRIKNGGREKRGKTEKTGRKTRIQKDRDKV